MRPLNPVLPLLLALALFGCGKPVPPEKSAYVGEQWKMVVDGVELTRTGQ